ncbi:MAG: hypothetical protein K9M98_10080 [Cephaloticoccus sp.]|nr:hypothetical protein [Cephaloticoccus sp.]MCF7760841.1 hypothetical protein [Cephaloticoccus sp.]
MTNLQNARDYQELLDERVETSPYAYATMFKAEGYVARRTARQRFALLRALDGKLRHILRPTEHVFYVTWGTTHSLAEQFFTGWMASALNMRALVFTTERVLLLQINARKTSVRELVAQIPYTAIVSVRKSWLGSCRIKLRDKTLLTFLRVPKGDMKFLIEFLSDIVKGSGAPFEISTPLGVQHLCPHCYVHVPAFPPACPQCGGRLKLASKAALLSFIFPGLGDWYLGHRGFAAMEIVGSAFIWWVLIVAPLLAPEDPDLGPITLEYWLTALFIMLVIHGTDAMMTRHAARKGHYPAGPMPHSAQHGS